MYKNIFYFKQIHKMGGTEQFLYEIAKKYNNYDIVILCDYIDITQRRRLEKYVRVIIRNLNETYECEKCFLNFNVDGAVSIKAKQYYFVSHAIYQELGYKPPIEDKHLTNYLGVSKYSARKLKEWADQLGKEITPEVCYNPLTLEPKEKVVHLISAGRFEDKCKGVDRINKLIEALDNYCSKTGRHYLWTIYSNSGTVIKKSKNVILCEPRIDIRAYIQDSDYLIQPSNDMETYGYSINEALGYGVPIVVTPLSILEELPITENEYIKLEYNCSNIDQVIKDIFEKEVKPFTYIPPKDNWNKLLVKGKNTYKQDIKTKIKVECISPYYDIQEERNIGVGELLYVNNLRADELIRNCVCKKIKK